MIQFRRRKKDGQAFPVGNKKQRISKSSSNQTSGMKIGSGIRVPKSEQKNVLDEAVKNMENSLAKSLSEYNFEVNPDLKSKDWEVDITYTGSHGTVDSEYFIATATPKGSSLSYQTDLTLSNDDWSDTGDEYYEERIQDDSDFAEEEYNKWLAGMLEQSDDYIFEGLIGSIENKWRGDE